MLELFLFTNRIILLRLVCHQLLLAPENGKAINGTKKAEWHPYKCAPASNSEPCVSALACQKNTLDAGIAPSVIPTQSLADLPPDHPNPTDDHPDPAGDYPDPADDIEAMDTTPNQHSAKGSATSDTHGSCHCGCGTCGHAAKFLCNVQVKSARVRVTMMQMKRGILN